MATYMIVWEVNPGNWPTDPKEVLAVWEAAAAGADRLLASGAFKEIRWTDNTAGYAVAECDSKADAIALCTPLFPYFSQTIEETVSWEAARDAVLTAARRIAGDQGGSS